MATDEPDPNWKLKLRYGKVTTPFSHYTVIAEGMVGTLVEGFSCPLGPAFMGMKAWASSTDEAVDMAQIIGQQVGFTVKGRVEVYDTEPEQPPGPNPRGYDIQFTPFDATSEDGEGEPTGGHCPST